MADTEVNATETERKKEPLTEEELLARKRFRKRLLIAAIVLLVLLIGGWFLTGFMLKYTTHSRMERMISRAHSFANVVHEWTDRGNPIESGIWHISGRDDALTNTDKKTDNFDKFAVYYLSGSGKEWFGLVLDEKGNVRYTLYSRSEIPEEYLQNPPDYDEQYKLLDSYFAFRRKKTIAVWDPQAKPEAKNGNDTETDSE
ncbi:MAG: hypothetical protein K6F80_02690 [Oscillospiraceae bacterium]|nr:hypothetical protein [Oscillospiraceae bacterium]